MEKRKKPLSMRCILKSLLRNRLITCAGILVATFSMVLCISHSLLRRMIHQNKHQHSQVSSPNSPTPKEQQQSKQRRQRSEIEELKTNDGYVFHIVFSSGCNALQDWQSYMFFYQVMTSGFTGNVTRVASCETDEQAEVLRKQHIEQIQGPMSPKFQLHTTPDYTRTAPWTVYNFFNKPFGVRHWMETSLGFPQNKANFEKTIMVLMDPDQFLLRTFKRNMTNGPEIWSDPNGYRIVAKGQPMAAAYGFGPDYIHKLNITELLDLPDIRGTAATSGLRAITAKILAKNYVIGAPYVVEATDMYNIVKTWAAFVVPIHAQMKGGTFMAEMYAYCLAAAHLNLPHEVSRSFMISDPEIASSEAWGEWIDDESKASGQDLCSLDYYYMPHSYHFCQRVYIGPYFFSKYQVPKDPGDNFLSCEHPLYQEPPPNVADLYNTSITLDGNMHNLTMKQRRRMAFAVCQILPRMNAAVAFFKDHHCTASSANYSKVFIHETHDAKKERLRKEKEAKEQLQTKKEGNVAAQ